MNVLTEWRSWCTMRSWVCEKKTSPVPSFQMPLPCSSIRISKRDTHIPTIQAYAFQINQTATHRDTDKKCAGNFFVSRYLYFRLVVLCVVLSIALETPSMPLNLCWKNTNYGNLNPKTEKCSAKRMSRMCDTEQKQIHRRRNRKDGNSGEIHGLKISSIYFWTQNNIRRSCISSVVDHLLFILFVSFLIVYLYVSTHTDTADARKST